MLVLRIGTRSFYLGDAGGVGLKARGLAVEYAGSGSEGLEFLRGYDFDVLLVDAHLADMSGQDLIRSARVAGCEAAMIIGGDHVTPEAKARALDQGADDFVTSQCHIEELLARIRAVVRRGHGHTRSLLRCGPVELSMDRREIRVRGERLAVSRREFGVLELLFLKQGTILTKNAFLNHVYFGGEEPEMKTIDVIVCRLRKKLAAAGIPDLVDTVWGSGYILREPPLIKDDARGAADMPMAA